MKNIQFNNVTYKIQIISELQYITGSTVNYNNELKNYIVQNIFCEMNNISARTLFRYRKLIKENNLSASDYYIQNNRGEYSYSQKILEFKSYKIRDQLLTSPVYIGYEHQQMVGEKTQLFKGLASLNWCYKGGFRTSNALEIYQCVNKMKKLYRDLCSTFPDKRMTFYYATEKNESYEKGYHNHFLLSTSITLDNRNTKRIERLIRKQGSNVPYIEKNTGIKYLKYTTKEVNIIPDGWGVISNSATDTQAMMKYCSNPDNYGLL